MPVTMEENVILSVEVLASFLPNIGTLKPFTLKKPYRQGFQVVIYSCFTYDDGGIS